VFTTITGAPQAGVRPVMTFTEDEGLTLILGQDEADARVWIVGGLARCRFARCP
jgi:hypothetical protein